ncbi:MAG: hypothetical protein HQ567_12930, partial [Candidatus Nealsonbacteria bacterium]|nr:hypothetical protein [Candidatus Nealsonbacteria bacterium]
MRIEPCEQRQLLAVGGPASIDGVIFDDLTGDGFTGDDVPTGGVTIELYADGGDGIFDGVDDVLEDTQVTAPVTGAYTFDGLPLGRYYIQEQVPAGYMQTAGPDYYTFDVIAGQVFSGSSLMIDPFDGPDPSDSYFISAVDADPLLIETTDASILGGERDLLVDVLGTSTPISASGTIG